MKFRSQIIIAMMVCALGASAQRAFEWNVDFGTVFDNREGTHEHTRAETIFFTTLRPTIGFRLDSHNSFAGGVNWTEPIGYDWSGHRVRPVLYYRHHSEQWSGSLGVFPRTQLIEEMPSFMWGDSLAYFKPEICGALLQWRSERSFAEIYIDWRQKQTDSKREAFCATAHGHWQHPERPWQAGAYLTLNHLALSKIRPEGMYIQDNLLASPYIGADFSRSTPLDLLRVRLGMAVTLERDRGDGIWHTPLGGWLNIVAGWRGFKLDNMTYGGGRLLPSYGIFGAELYQGEAFYAARFYNRTDASYSIVRKSWGTLGAHLIFNVTPGSFIFYQKVALTINIGQAYNL